MHWLFMLMLFRTGTILFGKGIMLRTFVLLVYFFVATQLTHQQLIHEVDLEWDDVAGYQLSTGTKTSTATTVFYHKIFRLDIVTRWVIGYVIGTSSPNECSMPARDTRLGALV